MAGRNRLNKVPSDESDDLGVEDYFDEEDIYLSQPKPENNTGIRSVLRWFRRRRKQLKEPDAFLQKFTGAAGIKESTFQDWWQIFTLKFWATAVVDPYGKLFFYWSGVNMCAVVYNGTFLFLRASFKMPTRFLTLWFVLDYTCDLIYLTDMFIRSRRAFYEKGLLVKDVKRLLKNYVKSYIFAVDCVSLLPTDITYAFGFSGFHAYYRFNRAMRIRRMMHFFRMAEGRSNFPNFVRVVNLLILVLIIIHCNACIYFVMSKSYGLYTDSWVYPSKGFQEFKDGRLDNFFFQYLFCFYWSTLTLTTIGDTHHPVKPLQTLYVIICSLLGVFIFATVFGNVGTMINNMGIKRTEHQNTVKNIKQYMDNNKIPQPVQKRIVNWLWYTWKNKQAVDDVEVLQHLPKKMRAEMGVCVHINTLRGIKMFKYCDAGLLEELVLKLNLRVFSPDDYVCRRGDIGREMYIVKQGFLQVLRDDGEVLVRLAEGQIFGEISVLEIPGNTISNRRTADVKAVGFVDLLCLSKKDLWKALENYPKAKEILVEEGKKILRKDNTLNEEEMRKVEEIPSDRLLIHRVHVSLQSQKLMMTLQNIHIQKFNFAAETKEILASIAKVAATSCENNNNRQQDTFTNGNGPNKMERIIPETKSAELTDTTYTSEQSGIRCRLNRSSPMSSEGHAYSVESDLNLCDNVTPSTDARIESIDTPQDDVDASEDNVDASEDGVDCRPGVTPSKLCTDTRLGHVSCNQDTVPQSSASSISARGTTADSTVKHDRGVECSSFVSLSSISCNVDERPEGKPDTKLKALHQTESSTNTAHPNVNTSHFREQERTESNIGIGVQNVSTANRKGMHMTESNTNIGLQHVSNASHKEMHTTESNTSIGLQNVSIAKIKEKLRTEPNTSKGLENVKVSKLKGTHSMQSNTNTGLQITSTPRFKDMHRTEFNPNTGLQNVSISRFNDMHRTEFNPNTGLQNVSSARFKDMHRTEFNTSTETEIVNAKPNTHTVLIHAEATDEAVLPLDMDHIEPAGRLSNIDQAQQQRNPSRSGVLLDESIEVDTTEDGQADFGHLIVELL